jgi:nicotinamide-nucleotide amidase
MDDITRETVADFCDVKLITDDDSVNHIESLIKSTHSHKYINNLKQAMLPESGIVIHNSTGTAQGFLVRTSQSSIICLPGVPAEMTLMFEDWVIPYILRESDDRREKCTKVINTFGMSESILDEKTREIIQPDEHSSYSTLVNDGIVSVRITVSDVEEKKAISILNEIEENICMELGEFVFSKGEDTLEDTISKLLKKHSTTLAVAESCTGGLVSNLLTNVQGSSDFFSGGIVSYSNKAKKDLLNVSAKLIEKYGVISAEVAKAMAHGVKERIQTDIGLAVTGIAGPAGFEEGIDQGKPVGLVYVATAINGDLKCEEYRFFGSRTDIKKRAANAVLNTLRLHLLGKAARC